MKSKRGFIGPIGDDLPSIFPIVAGILIFLLSIAYIQTQLSARNEAISLRKATLELSYIVTERGLMEQTDFIEKCTLAEAYAKKSHIEYALILKRYCGPVNLDNDEAFKIGIRPLGWNAANTEDSICSSDTNLAVTATPNPSVIIIPARDVVTMSFPIAVNCPETSSLRGLGMINVIRWSARGK